MRGFMNAQPKRHLPFSRTAPAIAAVALVMAAIFAPASFAAAPDPTYGVANVDGDPGEWDLTADFFTNMTNAGNPDQPTLANLYVRYDCDAEVLYGLVLVEDGLHGQQTRPENAYLRIDGAGKLVSGESGDNGTPPDFAWVNPDGTFADGFEGSGPLAPGTYTLRAHILIDDDSADGYAPADTVPRDAPLVVECEEPTPEPTPVVTPEPTPVVTPEPTPVVTPEPTPVVTPTASVEPSESTNPTPTPVVTPAPTTSVAPSESTNPTATPTGSVGGATGAPGITLPPTDTLPTTGGDEGSSDGMRAAYLMLAAILAGVAIAKPTKSRRRVPNRDDRG